MIAIGRLVSEKLIVWTYITMDRTKSSIRDSVMPKSKHVSSILKKNIFTATYVSISKCLTFY